MNYACQPWQFNAKVFIGKEVLVVAPGTCRYSPVIMARQKKTKMSSGPYVFTKPEAIINVQLRYKERDPEGRLQFKASKTLTATGITLEEAYDRIVEALQKKE